ncbi:MAG TPA: hypothetical protein IAD11_11145 [Candidatus Stercorousia faecigallinarum]|nr:hypothetical protein [Candidatus Stercorousia faecigallinarum]
MDKEELEKLIDTFIDKVPSLTKNSSPEEKQKILDEINYVLQVDPINIKALEWKVLYYSAIEDYDNVLLAHKEFLKVDPNNKDLNDLVEICKESIKTDNKSYTTKNASTQEPGLLDKLPPQFLLVVKIVILAAVIYFCFPSVFFSFNDNKMLNIRDYSNFQSVQVNPLSEYNYLTKKQIFDIRKNHVKNSLFSKEDYEPDTRVFGAIADSKPWWGTVTCGKLNYKGDYHERIEGASKVSAQMNNPDALVGLSLPFLPWDLGYNKEFCTADYSKFLPISIQYSEENNLIIAKYKLTKNFLKFRASVNRRNTRYPIQLSGLNALDFGYDYVYAYDTKNISMFDQNNNVTDDLKIFRDYIHLGGSCKYKDGCNNISPMQNDLMFTVTALPAEINLKLWKKKPMNKYIKADMYYRIQFTE